MKVLAQFVWIEAKCCLFPFALLLGLAVTQKVTIPGIARYDAMLVYCLLLRWAMVKLKLETLSELRVVTVFHALGLALELHRTSIGAWSYPDPGLLRIGQVPLYSGFMYASVASFLLQAWWRFRLSFERLPPWWLSVSLAAAGYASFFVWPGGKPWLVLAILVSLVRTTVHFDVGERRYRMPLGLSFSLIGIFLWVAENLGTYLGAWRYPYQANGWQPVEGTKALGWFLLTVVGFLIIERYKAGKSVPEFAYGRSKDR